MIALASLLLRPADVAREESVGDGLTILILCVVFGVPAAVAIGAAIRRRLKKRSASADAPAP